ncbi:hypothetical protein GA565_14185 [Rouxiella sp. S1S-2]|uniref:hypothetical protein n=1 Tax=Rouxiella sp. S1S-2 TaxID=2653856 RepID=UPI00126421E9|nr:hypothetical protein [Rouxiella sp. S1S-2]KAB7897042.1 hypothetical protein GA565_14185 [Rouxiella sp. S1S-2]
MSRLNVVVKQLSGSFYDGPIISASTLADYTQAADIIDRAEHDALALRSSAQEYLEDIEQHCAEAREAARQEGEVWAAEDAPLHRREAVADAVEWLISEHQLESDIIRRLEPKMRTILAQVFKEFYVQQDNCRLLLDRLRDTLDKLLQEEAGTLFVCPEQWEELRLSFASYPALQVKMNEHLGLGEARLVTPLVSLSINLEDQLESILARLLKMSEDNYYAD